MSEETEGAGRSFARYKPDISLGNILTIIAMAATIIVWGARLESRVDTQQQMMTQQRETYDLRLRYVENSISQQRADVEKALVSIDRSLQRIEGKLDGKVDK